MWFLLSVLSRLCFASCNILDSHLVRGWFKSPFSLNFIVALFTIPVAIFLYVIVAPPNPSPELLGWIIITGLLQGFYLVPYYVAMEEGDSSVVTSLFTLGRSLTPILAYLLIAEQLSIWGYVGFFITVFGAIFQSYAREHKKFHYKLAALMALSGFMVALFTVTSKVIFDREGLANGFTHTMLATSLFTLVTVLSPRQAKVIKSDMRKLKKILPLVALGAGMSFLANFLGYFSVSLTKASYVTLVAQFQPFFILMMMAFISRFGILHTKEALDKGSVMQKLIGFVIMAGGMALTLLV